jgi:phosphatidylglycerophosphate synthase
MLLLDASDAAGTRRAQQALVRDTQKHVMDAPARWIDPFFENAILTRLAPTRVTPNQVTLVASALGFLAAWGLWHGHLALALPLMFLVGWLDGVDGKLARLRLHYTRVGAAESFFDFAYENAWWIALSAFLAGAGHGETALWLGAALVAGNLLDEVNYTLSDAWLGRSLDLLTPADGAFRLVAGRRNIYVVILAIATLLGSTWAGFVVCSLWAVATGLAHAARLGFAVRGGAGAEAAA